MVSDNILVTAGHCVWDWQNRNEPAAIVVASFGYHDDTLQWDEHRYGLEVLMSEYSCHSLDFAFIILSNRTAPFTSIPISPFRWYDTPLRGSGYLFIPGYPGDRDVQYNAMFEGVKWVDWDLISEIGTLKHHISTFRGEQFPFSRRRHNSSYFYTRPVWITHPTFR